MQYLSVCSGIEAATVAWKPLGWQAVAYSEIEKFPSAVLAHHYGSNMPGEDLSRNGTPNLGDMTKFKEWPDYANLDVLVGGTPCQAFSVAGLRKGLNDPRGNLALVYLGIANRYRPKWLVWENVPGVLSSHEGLDFGAFLGALGKLGYGWACRVLDAQYFGVAQRRRRVFVVGYLGDWRRAHAVLFERESLSGNPAPSRKKGTGTSQGFEVGPGASGFTDISPTLDARCKDGPIRNQLGVGVLEQQVYGGGQTSGPRDVAATLVAHGNKQDFEVENFVTAQQAIAFDCKASATHMPNPLVEHTHTLRSMNGKGRDNGGGHIAFTDGSVVRRLTPTECERLQGFTDNYTNIHYGRPKHEGQICPDGPRYKALGNSMAVPVMRWIGERINKVDALKGVA